MCLSLSLSLSLSYLRAKLMLRCLVCFVDVAADMHPLLWFILSSVPVCQVGARSSSPMCAAPPGSSWLFRWGGGLGQWGNLWCSELAHRQQERIRNYLTGGLFLAAVVGDKFNVNLQTLWGISWNWPTLKMDFLENSHKVHYTTKLAHLCCFNA